MDPYAWFVILGAVVLALMVLAAVTEGVRERWH